MAEREPRKATGTRARSRPSVTPRDKSLESWIWDAACSIRGAKDAPKNKDCILRLIFTTRLCPSRYIHTSDAETYRPIAEIVEELQVNELEARETDKAHGKILKQLGV